MQILVGLGLVFCGMAIACVLVKHLFAVNTRRQAHNMKSICDLTIEVFDMKESAIENGDLDNLITSIKFYCNEYQAEHRGES